MAEAEEKKFSIEENLNELESITEKLRSGGLTMEESLKLYETGIRLIREGQKYLDETEAKIRNLSKEPENDV